jgi:hypothetical protein
MFSPHLQRLVVQARVEELHRDANTAKLGRDVNRPKAARLSAVLRPAINRLVAVGRVTALGQR